MVAYSLDCSAAVARRRARVHREFGHSMGIVSVFVNHAGAAPYPRPFGILP